MKTTWLILGVLFGLAISATAQTNEPVVQVKFYSDPNATNEITFLKKGPVEGIRGVVEGTFPKLGRVLVATMSPVIGDFGIVDRWQESGNEIVLADYPALEILTTGKEFIFKARKIGTIRGLKSDGTDSSRVLELWEYYTPPQPTPEETATAKAAQEKAIAAAKAKTAEQKTIAEARALQANQDAAAKGDSYGLSRCGRRALFASTASRGRWNEQARGTRWRSRRPRCRTSHPGDEVEGVAAVFALAETIPDIFADTDAELCRVAAFVDRTRAAQTVCAPLELVQEAVALILKPVPNVSADIGRLDAFW